MWTETFLITVVFAAGSLVQAQSLGEAAAKEKERRARTHVSGKTLTDSDLGEAAVKRAREGSFPSGASPSPPAAGAKASPRPPARKDDGAASTAVATDTETIERAKQARGQDYKVRLEAANIALTAAEKRLKEAEYQWSRVYMQSVGFPLEQAAAHLASARAEYALRKQQRDDLEDGARREGIPPGYMR